MTANILSPRFDRTDPADVVLVAHFNIRDDLQSVSHPCGCDDDALVGRVALGAVVEGLSGRPDVKIAQRVTQDF